MSAGVAVKNWNNYGWQTYAWALAKPVNTSMWTSAVLAPEAGPATQRALDCTVTVPNAGTVTILYGTRAGSYTAKTLPIPVPAATPVAIRLTDLRPNTPYYANPQWMGVVPAAPGGLPQSGTFQFGELSASTP